MVLALLKSSPASNSSPHLPRTSAPTSTIFGTQLRFLDMEQTQLGLLNSSKKDIILRLQTSMQPSGLTPRDKNVSIPALIMCIHSLIGTPLPQSLKYVFLSSKYLHHIHRNHPDLRLKASRYSQGLIKERTDNKPKSAKETPDGVDSFAEMKNHFLSFKRHKYLENLECFQKLCKAQAPKFMVISCADSRVCPSYILGFQPGEAFVIRNIANLVPPYEKGSCETNAALEFSVNNLEVENILVTGHSCCGGIRALMSMEDGLISSSFITSWVANGKDAKLGTKAVASNLSFDQQCRHCEKESINRSLLNLLTYPWIEERVAKGLLWLHGGYYDFVDCTYEKWTLDYETGSSNQGSGVYSVKNREFWS